MDLTRRRRSFAVVLFLTASVLAIAPGAMADHGGDPTQVATAANPQFPDQCGIDIGIALDTSNSIIADSPGNPATMKAAAKAFVTALSGTPSRVSVYSFQTNASLELGLTDVSTEAGANAVRSAIDGVVFGNGSPTGGTNWEDGFLVTQGQGLDVLAYATDGNPTTHNGDGDPGFPPGEDEDLEAGITASNASKAQGTRIVGIGIGGSIDQAKLQRITGPTVGDDYYLPASFAAFEATLQDIAKRLCAPSVTAQNLVDATGSGTYVPQAGWTYDGVPTTASVVANPPSRVTEADGLVNFKLSDPDTIEVTQTTQVGFILESVTCQLTDGTPLAGTPITDGISLTLDAEAIAVCEFRNVAQLGGLALDKVPDTVAAVVGETITYDYTITNTGNVTMDNLTLTDDLLGAITLAATSLAPGASTTGTATHVVTAADLAGPITNVATATGTDPLGNQFNSVDEASVDVAAFSIDKVADTTIADVGDVITYTYTVTNIGSAELTDIAITDDKLGPITLAATTLAAGASTTGTATHTVTAADISGAGIVNVATGTATDPEGDPVVPDPVTETVDVAELTLVKTVDTTSVTVGDTATYTFVITNTGSVTIDNIVLNDDKIGPVTLLVTTLAPGESTTATATYVVTAADAASPPLVNVGTVTGTDPEGNPLTSSDTAEIPTIVLQAATTTTTVAATLPKTGGQVESGPVSSVGATFIMLGVLLLLVAFTRRRQLAAVRQVTSKAADWAKYHLGR